VFNKDHNKQANSLPIPGQETHGAENNNLGMLQHSSPQGMGNFVNSFEGRLQVSQSLSVISSVFDPISSHILVKIKEKIWKGEFIDLNLFLKSAKDLVNEPSLEGELAIKGRIFTVVNQKKNSINNIRVWTSTFMIYASVMLEKFTNNGQEYLMYMQTVRKAASRGVNGGWVQYDEQFRLRKTHYPTSS
jgi:hypothetical protein